MGVADAEEVFSIYVRHLLWVPEGELIRNALPLASIAISSLELLLFDCSFFPPLLDSLDLLHLLPLPLLLCTDRDFRRDGSFALDRDFCRSKGPLT